MQICKITNLANSINFIKDYDMQITLVPWKVKGITALVNTKRSIYHILEINVSYRESSDHFQHQQTDP